MDQMFSEVTPEGAKGYLKAIASVYDKFEKKEHAKAKLINHINKVKKVTKKKTVSRRSVEKDMKTMETLLNEVLEAERNILSVDKHDSISMNELKKTIAELQNKLLETENSRDNLLLENNIKLNQLTTALHETKQQLELHATTNKDREERLLQLEQKIRNSTNKNLIMLLQIEEHIKQLEDKHQNLSMSGNYSHAELMRIEAKLDNLKTKLSKLKAEVES